MSPAAPAPAANTEPPGVDVAPSLTTKEQGNAQFKAKKYLKAAALYTQAIKEDPKNAALYSNRSAAFLHLSKVTKALADAEMAVELKPDWDKGYYRKACALESMKRYEEAHTACKHSSALNPATVEVSLKLKALARAVRDEKRAWAATQEEEKLAQSGSSKGGGEAELRAAIESRVAKSRHLQSFERDMLAEVGNSWSESGGKIDPSVTFLQPNAAESGKDQLMKIVVKEAFDSPELHDRCLVYLREHGGTSGAEASCLAVARNSITCPQVWKGRSRVEWPFGDAEGCLVQLDSPNLRRIWFLKEEEGEGSHKRLGAPHELDVDVVGLFQPIFR